MMPQSDFELWEAARAAHTTGDAEQTMSLLAKLGRSAKALYNRAMLTGNVGLLREAVEVDPYLAIGHFQLAGLLEEQNQPAEAMQHYRLCLAAFREASFIDYTQLGLPRKLFQWQVWFNLGLLQLGGMDRGAGLRSLVKAHHLASEAERPAIEEAIASLGDQVKPITLEGLFWPARGERRSPSVNLDPLIFDDIQAAWGSMHSRTASIASCLGQAKRTLLHDDDESVPNCSSRCSSREGSIHSRRGSIPSRREECPSRERSVSGSSYLGSNQSSFHYGSSLLVKVSMTLGAEYRDPEHRVFSLLEPLSLAALQSALETRFKASRLRIKYRDGDGDWIVMVDEGDFYLACREAPGLLRLWCHTCLPV